MVQRPANGFLTPPVFAEVGGGGERPDHDHLDVVGVVDDDVVLMLLLLPRLAVLENNVTMSLIHPARFSIVRTSGR